MRIVLLFAIAAVLLFTDPLAAQVCKQCNDANDCATAFTSPSFVNCASNGTICRVFTPCDDKDPLGGGSPELSAAPPCSPIHGGVPNLYAVHTVSAIQDSPRLRLASVAIQTTLLQR